MGLHIADVGGNVGSNGLPETLEGTGIQADAVQRYINEQVYTLPGTERHHEEFSILLTGSRAIGAHRENSDVDLDVLCPRQVYEVVHRASLDAGIVKAPTAFWCPLRDEDWHRYFRKARGRLHFSLNALETIAQQLGRYEDVPLWVWTHAKVLKDPGGQFQRIVDGFRGYPRDVLVRKVKYHWLAAGYWAVTVFPHGSNRGSDILAATSAVANSVNELLRLFSLVEGQPYPYTERLMGLAESTKLGKEFYPLLRHVVDLLVGQEEPTADLWKRLETACTRLWCYDKSEDARRLDEVCSDAMIAAGVEPDWVKADYDNIDELLHAKLGPFLS